ncbi:MAG: MBL fold metallo-hydrolase [Anaerofustis sp.]
MLIRALAENTSVSETYGCEHGLSLYIEIDLHKILFDMGRKKLFLENAKKMGINLSDVDIAFVSHGHFDHGGGLRAFLGVNEIATVYVNRKAFDGHRSVKPNGIEDIGLERSLYCTHRFVMVGDELKIDEELELFSDIKTSESMCRSQKSLTVESSEGFVPDTFEHEQNLIITQGARTALITGCAHRGIVNILKRYIERKGSAPDLVVGGFHLSNPDTGEGEDPALIDEIAAYLSALPTKYYTCHCTGLASYQLLKERMGDQIEYLSTGGMIEF